MHTDRVSHQRNVIRLHSYIEYFSRNFLLFLPASPSPSPSLPPRFVLPPTIPMMKIFRKARPHASRTSEMWNVNKRRAFCQRGTKDQGICHGLKASNFISLNQNILKTERPSSACRVPFSKAAILADNRPKSRPIRGRESAPIGVSFFSLSLFFILIDNYSSFASLFACIFSWLKGKIRFDDFFFFFFISSARTILSLKLSIFRIYVYKIKIVS